MTVRYGISEWFGLPFAQLSPTDRQALAQAALRHTAPLPCPFQRGRPLCRKSGGVCSIQAGNAQPVITCPSRFDDGDLLPIWLARIVGFPDVYLATEVPFMRSPSTGRAAGRIDLVVARDGDASSWFGLEVQAVYFSGKGMQADFERYVSTTLRHSRAAFSEPRLASGGSWRRCGPHLHRSRSRFMEQKKGVPQVWTPPREWLVRHSGASFSPSAG